MLLIVDIVVLLLKSYLAVETLLAAKYRPKQERRYFNQYFMVSVCYYVNSVFKYALIDIAFKSSGNVVHCYFVTLSMVMGASGVLFFSPCIYVALKQID